MNMVYPGGLGETFLLSGSDTRLSGEFLLAHGGEGCAADPGDVCGNYLREVSEIGRRGVW